MVIVNMPLGYSVVVCVQRRVCRLYVYFTVREDAPEWDAVVWSGAKTPNMELLQSYWGQVLHFLMHHARRQSLLCC